MKDKNWREWAFIFYMVGIIQYVILTFIAMLFYTGGTLVDPSAPGYSFWANWFSDLGRTKAYSGKDNSVSRVIFIITVSIRGISLIILAIAFPYFFRENRLENILSNIGSFFLVITGILVVGIAFTPWDIYFYAHVFFVGMVGWTGNIALILYLIVVFHNLKYPNKNALPLIVVLVVGFISSIILNLFAVPFTNISTTQELMVYTVNQKINGYTSMVCTFLISYGAWKQIKS